MTGPVLLRIDPIRGETLMSLVTRVSARNVLPSSHVILEQVGALHAHNPTAALVPGLDEEKLAGILRLPIHDIRIRRHATCGEAGFVDMLGATVRSDELVFRRRRFSPASVAISPHIRSLWSHKLVPCCIESWEYLVDRCRCGTLQGWRRACRLDRCDRCCASLAKTPAAEVDDGLREDLAFLIGLLDPTAGASSASRRLLPSSLADWNGGLVFDLALSLMPLTSTGYVPKRGRSPTDVERPAFTRSLAEAGRLVRGWPSSLLEAVERQVAMRSRSRTNVRYRGVSDHFLGLDSRMMPDCVRGAISDALEPITALPGTVPEGQIAMRDAALLTGQEERNLASARREGLLIGRTCMRWGRLMPTLDRADVERLDDALANRLSPYRASSLLGLPSYAIQLLIERDLISPIAHPYVTSRYGWGQIHEAELECFKSLLAQATVASARDGSKDRDAPTRKMTRVSRDGLSVPLHRAMRAIGGGLKPWGRIIACLLDKSIPFAMDGPAVNMIRISQADALKLLTWECHQPDELWAEHCSQRDAAEILNLPLKHAAVLASSSLNEGWDLNWTQVLDAAAREVTLAELSARTGIHATRLECRLQSHSNLCRTAIGWQRDAALDAISSMRFVSAVRQSGPSGG